MGISRLRLALPIIAAEPTIDGAADKIGVTRKTLYEWLKQEPFKLAVDQARKEYVESAFRTIRLATRQAADKIVKHLDSTDERLSLRAAEDVIEFAKEFINMDDHERRIAELEGKLLKENSSWPRR